MPLGLAGMREVISRRKQAEMYLEQAKETHNTEIHNDWSKNFTLICSLEAQDLASSASEHEVCDPETTRAATRFFVAAMSPSTMQICRM